MNVRYSSVAILYMLFVIYLSSIPAGSFPGSGSVTEQTLSNLAHIPEYGLLAFLWLKVFAGNENTDTFSVVNILILSGVMIFAVSDEIHQSFVPGRSASFIDIGLDGLGALLGLWALRILRDPPIGRYRDPTN
ncbi:MAG: VanZ family protein [Thermodesulfobacteriota bacterium]|nr:VanZ family protein [Thermodesulfobacteriota bacterium]